MGCFVSIRSDSIRLFRTNTYSGGDGKPIEAMTGPRCENSLKSFVLVIGALLVADNNDR